VLVAEVEDRPALARDVPRDLEDPGRLAHALGATDEHEVAAAEPAAEVGVEHVEARRPDALGVVRARADAVVRLLEGLGQRLKLQIHPSMVTERRRHVRGLVKDATARGQGWAPIWWRRPRRRTLADVTRDRRLSRVPTRRRTWQGSDRRSREAGSLRRRHRATARSLDRDRALCRLRTGLSSFHRRTTRGRGSLRTVQGNTAEGDPWRGQTRQQPSRSSWRISRSRPALC
jgi:hypothetical protein